jgi:hypothetical protein
VPGLKTRPMSSRPCGNRSAIALAKLLVLGFRSAINLVMRDHGSDVISLKGILSDVAKLSVHECVLILRGGPTVVGKYATIDTSHEGGSKMREGKLAVFLGGVLTLLSSAAYAGSPPKELYGKSIIITWTEHRNQRHADQANFRDVDIPLSRKIYISTEGHFFGRFSAMSPGGREGAREAVGMSGTSAGGGPREAQFSGRTVTLTGASTGGLARRTTIEFNESFTTCEAHVIFAKQSGSDVVVSTNLVTGGVNEIRSATVTSVSCSVRDGNVFAQ